MNNKSVITSVHPDASSRDSILYKFESLKPGNGFIIHEDNDPHSIYSQMLKEKGDTFSWEYLAVGPKKWSIKISKRQNDNLKQTLGEIALSDHRKALILRKYGLDYSFKGKRSLREACVERDISTKNVERELAQSDQQSLVYTIDYNRWELDYLTDFITTNHHQYTRKILASISKELGKNAKLIQQHYPYLLPLVDAFTQLDITMHIIMQQEEQVLFPYIRFLVQVTRGKIIGNLLPSGSVRDHISTIEAEHKKVGEQINFLRAFTKEYKLPDVENPFYMEVLQSLNEFDNDLHQHVHIETNILFRKALMLEKEYLASATSCAYMPEQNHSGTNYLAALL